MNMKYGKDIKKYGRWYILLCLILFLTVFHESWSECLSDSQETGVYVKQELLSALEGKQPDVFHASEVFGKIIQHKIFTKRTFRRKANTQTEFLMVGICLMYLLSTRKIKIKRKSATRESAQGMSENRAPPHNLFIFKKV